MTVFIARSKRTQNGREYNYWQLKVGYTHSLGNQTYRQQQVHIASLGEARGNACRITKAKARELVERANAKLDEKGINERIELDDLQAARRLVIVDDPA